MNEKIRMNEMLAELLSVCKKAHTFVGERINFDTHADGMPYFSIGDESGLVLATINIKWIRKEPLLIKMIKEGKPFNPWKISIDVVGDNIGNDNFLCIVKRSRDLWNAYGTIVNWLVGKYGQ